MRALNVMLGTLSRTVSLLLAAIVVLLAAATAATALTVQDIAQWMERILGLGFLGLFALLVGAGLFCWLRLLQRNEADRGTVWLEAGLNAANGLTTLALTFTLLGISLGIGGLAEQDLTPETVQAVIRNLTQQFSLAFMTTVIGLPCAAALRALLLITHAWQRDKARPQRLLTHG